MKYSSPLIPDGSITFAKLAAAAVHRSNIFTTESSQAGPITTLGSATIAMQQDAYFPDIATDMPVSASVHLKMAARFNVIPNSDAALPRFSFHNEDSITVDYSVSWRRING